MRINKYIAACGVCSRRHADDLIKEGRVEVNSETVYDFVDVSDGDRVCVDGQDISLEKKKYYIALNKPEGYITTVSDDFGRPSVMDLVTEIDARLFPVGRLDYNTRGLLILTNDGDFANRVMHPSNNVTKTYVAHIKGFPTILELNRLSKGIMLDDGKTAPAKAEIIKAMPASCLVRLTISEGRNRIVRRMFAALGYEILELERIEIGGLKLGHIPYGKWRHLKKAEIELFK